MDSEEKGIFKYITESLEEIGIPKIVITIVIIVILLYGAYLLYCYFFKKEPKLNAFIKRNIVLILLILSLLISFFVIKSNIKLFKSNNNYKELLIASDKDKKQLEMLYQNELKLRSKDSIIDFERKRTKDTVTFLETKIEEIESQKNNLKSSDEKEKKRLNNLIIQFQGQIKSIQVESENKISSLTVERDEALADKKKLLAIIDQQNKKIEAQQKIIDETKVNPISCNEFNVEIRRNGYNEENGKVDKDQDINTTDKAKKIIELGIDFELSRPKENNDYFTIRVKNNLVIVSQDIKLENGKSKGLHNFNLRKKTLQKGQLTVEFCNVGKVITTKTYTLK